MIIDNPIISGSAILSGSLTITGSINISNGITGSINNAVSASYASNADLLDNRDSSTYANTGSNSFVGQQNINGSVAVTGSLTTTGTIVAQTLNVQQVTSSVLYSSGSNVFGNSLSNTQVMTGSVSITGSLGVNGVLSGTSATFSNGIIATAPSSAIVLELRARTSDDFSQISFTNNTGSNINSSIGVEKVGTNGGLIYFYTKPNGGSISERMRITSDGNVGIGTTSPTQVLQVNGTGLFTGTTLSGNTAAGIYINDQNIYSLNGSNSRPLNIQAETLTFFTGTIYTERMRITSDGKVGISDTNPQTTLAVNGTIGANITTLSYPYHGTKLFVGGPTSAYVINVATEFPQVLLTTGNAWGVIGRCTFLGTGGTVEVREFYIGRNTGGGWSTANYGPTSNTAASLQSVTASGTSVTINMNANTYVTVELTVMVR